MVRECRFQVDYLPEKELYPERFRKCDDSELMLLEDCLVNYDGMSERNQILLRTGLTNIYGPTGKLKRWLICGKHREYYGGKFVHYLIQKKCIYPGHRFGMLENRRVSDETSREFLDLGWIVPFRAKVCQKCMRKIPADLARLRKEKEEEAEAREAAANEEEAMDSQDLDGNQLTPSVSSYAPSSSRESSQTLGSQSQPASQQTEEVTDKLLSLVQTVEPSFTFEKIMKKTTKRYAKLGRTTKWKIRQTGALAIKAIVSAMTQYYEDAPEIWRDLKESGCVEETMGFQGFLDSNLEVIIEAHNMAPTPDDRLQVVTAVADVKFKKLDQFNPPKTPKPKIQNNLLESDTEEEQGDNELAPKDEEMPSVDEEMRSTDEGETKDKGNDELSDIASNSKEAGTKKPKRYWNPPLTAKFHRKSKVHRTISKAALQKVKKKVRRRQTVETGTIAFVVDILTSEQHQQGVAHGTMLVKCSDGTRVRIARVIRKQHQAYLVRLIRAHLKENGMQVLKESTLKRLLKLLPAGHQRDIVGLDPKYEYHRRAFVDLQEICTELHNFYSAKDDLNNADLAEKTQQGLATSASYLLGHFAYNLEENSKCASHDINLACTDSTNVFQQDEGTRENLDETEGYPEECNYCDLLPASCELLEQLLEEAKDNFTDLEYNRRSKKMKDSREYIVSYKKQVFRNWVSSKRWDQYYKDKNPKRAIAKMDFAMRMLLQKARETQGEFFCKKGTSWHAIAYERMVETNDGWVIEVEVHIQILKSDTKQDSAAVVALTLASLKQYKASNMEIEEIIYGADNAGCYHCEDTVVQLWRHRNSVEGVTILGLHFCEPGRGKCICDQYFAILKALVNRYRLAGNDVNSPEEFSEAMTYDGGIANTVIQIGDIRDRPEDEKKTTKKIVKDISKYREFLFEKDGIKVRHLPGFGTGELIKVDSNQEETTIPWFDFVTPSAKNLNEHGRCNKSTTVPYREECTNVNDVKGGRGDIANNVQMDSSSDEDESDNEGDKLVLFCDDYPRCTRTFLRASDRQTHIDNKDIYKCKVEVDQKSTDEQAIEMYIAKNGISQQYQDKTFKETRKMIFHEELLPTIDPILIKSGHKENLFRGHALPPPRVHTRFSEKQRKFMIDKFNTGAGKNKKHLKKKAHQVERQMQEADFTVDEWLSEKQIHSFFNGLYAKVKDAPYVETVKKNGVDQDPTEGLTFAELDQAARTLKAIQEDEVIAQVEAGMDPNAPLDEHDDDGPHPIRVPGLNEDLCYLAADVLDASVQYSKLKEYTNKILINAMESIDVKLNKKSTKAEICNAIVKHVQANCDCLLLRENSH